MPDQYHNAQILDQASELHKAGKLIEAEALYKQANAYMSDPNILNNLSLIYLDINKEWEAEKLAWRAYTLASQLQFLRTLLLILVRTYQLKFAASLIDNWLASDQRDSAKAIYKDTLGKTSLQSRKPAQKETRKPKLPDRLRLEIENILKTKNSPRALSIVKDILGFAQSIKLNKYLYINLAAELQYRVGNLAKASELYRLSHQTNPHGTECLSGLATIKITEHQYGEARKLLEKAIQNGDTSVSTYANLGTVARYLNDFQSAINNYRIALLQEPENAELIGNLAVVHRMSGEVQEYERLIVKAYLLNPANLAVMTNYSNYLSSKFEYGKAISILHKAKKILPDKIILNNLGNLYEHYGEPSRAIEAFDSALKLDSCYQEARTNKLFAANYDPTLTPQTLYSLYREYNQSVEVAEDQNLAKRVIRKPNKSTEVVNIGFVSGDFNNHPVYNFLSPVIDNIDRKKFKISLYSNNALDDIYTKWYKSRAENYVEAWRLSDAQLFDRIHHDGIDFLIDLSGHTAHNRLSLFKKSPVKKSATWIGYNYTSGLDQIDYFLTDDYQFRKEMAEFYSEAPLSLGATAYCFRLKNLDGNPPEEAAVSAFLKNGYVTFGSFSRGVRLNEGVISSWAEILHKVPKSKLRLDSRSFADPSVSFYFSEKFNRHGIARERIIFCYTSIYRSIQEVDIVLDCFPHNSGTTLFEAAYFGRPFVTLSGDLSLARLGGSILVNLGLQDLIACTREEYVNIAVSLGLDKPRIGHLHARISTMLKNSQIMDESGFVRNFEAKVLDTIFCS